MTTPRTAAGRALLDQYAPPAKEGDTRSHRDAAQNRRIALEPRILAIEAEARAAALDEARAAVDRCKQIRPFGTREIYRADALAAIDALRERTGEPTFQHYRCDGDGGKGLHVNCEHVRERSE